MNLLTKTTSLAMDVTLKYVSKGDFVIDATCGNGNDTLYLAEAVGNSGNVLAIDIQSEALDATQSVLVHHDMKQVRLQLGNFRDLIHLSEQNFPKLHPTAVVFNLGYLPGGDKSVTTLKEDSLRAVEAALHLIKVDGIVTVVLYSGHEAGALEKRAILEMAENLPAKEYHVVYGQMYNQKKNPPEILWITKKMTQQL